MKSFSLYLQELTLQRRPLLPEEARWGKKFQYALKAIMAYQNVIKTSGPNEELLQRVKKAIAPINQEPWAGRVLRWLDDAQSHFDQIKKSQKELESLPDFSKIAELGRSALAGGPQRFLKFSQQYGKIPLHRINARGEGEDAYVPKQNPLKKSGSGFFRSAGFMDNFSEPQIEKAISIDLSKAATALPFPAESEDYEHVAYWFTLLSDNTDKWEVPDSQLKRAGKLLHPESKDYDELIHSVETYLQGSSRKALDRALELLPQFPIFVERNNIRKGEITTVYRGLRDMDREEGNGIGMSAKEIAAEEKRRKYVATSSSERVAMRFVQKGGAHLMVRKENTPGWLLTYEVDPKSVVLDTGIFGGIFGEDEIVIDTTKAKLISTEFFPGDDGEDEDEWDDEDED